MGRCQASRKSGAELLMNILGHSIFAVQRDGDLWHIARYPEEAGGEAQALSWKLTRDLASKKLHSETLIANVDGMVLSKVVEKKMAESLLYLYWQIC